MSNTTNGLPVPVAYFPLAQDDASSWPLPQWTAEATNISWTMDPVFGLTVTCTVSSCRQQSAFRTAHVGAHPSGSVCESSSSCAVALQRGTFLGTSCEAHYLHPCSAASALSHYSVSCICRMLPGGRRMKLQLSSCCLLFMMQAAA